MDAKSDVTINDLLNFGISRMIPKSSTAMLTLIATNRKNLAL